MAATGSPVRAGDDLAWSAAFEAMEMAAVCLDPEGRVTEANPFLLALAGRSRDEVIGRNWFSDLVSHRDRVRARRAVASVVASGEAARMRSSLCGRGGEIHLLEWSVTPTVGPAGQVAALLLLGEVAGQNEATLSGLRTTNDIIRAVLAGQDPGGVLRAVADGARDLLDADLGAIVVPAGDTELAVLFAVGFDASKIEGTRYTRAGSTTGRVLDDGRPVAVTSPDGPAKDRPDHWFAPFGPGLFLPLSAGGQFGTLILARRRGEPYFTDHDLRVVTTLAGQLALALEFARAQEDLRTEALLRDQERIARDLHDRVVQRIHAASWGLQAANSLGGAPEQILRIERAVAELDRAVAEIRATIFAIHAEGTGGHRDRIVRVVTGASERLASGSS
jgi:PAS domain S-box-containing protein